jgi:hypothetical protein
MNAIVTNAEMIFWCVVGAATIAFVLAMPFINNYIKNQEAREMLGF